jgi:archaemetzincin
MLHKILVEAVFSFKGYIKASLAIVGLSILLSCPVMGFTYKKPKETTHAIGSTEGIPGILKRALTSGKAFELLPEPKQGEWLAEHPERGQTFNQFVRSDPEKPAKQKDRIFLQPLGAFPKGLSPSVETLKAYARAFFALDVEVLAPLMTDAAGIRERRNPYTENRQILTRDILTLLKKQLPQNAFCALAITMEDLYPDPSWNFVFGQASFRDRVGVFSFARYHPAFYGERRGKNDQEILLRRSCKVLAHEACHMFQLEHCVFFKCLMNGSNHLQESDARLFHLCPVCLRKLHFSIGFDVVERYRSLLQFYDDFGFGPEAKWVSGRLKSILGPEEAE